jgi:nucleoside-diphosphate-sugar epimerase
MSAKGTRVFITGATGFLGCALARSLSEIGAEVHAVARGTSDRRVLEGLAVTWHEAELASRSQLTRVLASAEWIIHAAGRLGQSNVPEELYFHVNVEGTRNVLAAAMDTGSRPRVLHLSSPGVLGPTSREPASEDAPLAPGNPYERSKAAAELVAHDFAARGLDVTIARPGFVYGPGDRHVLNLFRALRRGQFFYINGGRSQCQPTFISDAVAGMLRCLHQGSAGEAYHIVGPRAVTFRELGETIAGVLGVRSPWLSVPRWVAETAARGSEAVAHLIGWTAPLSRTGVDFFSEDRVFSWQKAHNELGYTPQYDLAAGITRTAAWYRERGWL